jgi:hypothetical protein
VIATGRGDGTVDLRPLEVGRNPFRRGDIVVTSGTGGLYPPNVPVARVIRLDDDGAIAFPMADPAKVSFAVVERPTKRPRCRRGGSGRGRSPPTPTERAASLMVRAALGRSNALDRGPSGWRAPFRRCRSRRLAPAAAADRRRGRLDARHRLPAAARLAAAALRRHPGLVGRAARACGTTWCSAFRSALSVATLDRER